MSEAIHIVVKGEPVGKGRPRFGINKYSHRPMIYTPPKSREYEEYVQYHAKKSMSAALPIEGACSVYIRIFIPAPLSWSDKKKKSAYEGKIMPTKKPDCDNYLKSVCDALNKVVYKDDAQIVDMVAIKRYSDDPRLEITVTEF